GTLPATIRRYARRQPGSRTDPMTPAGEEAARFASELIRIDTSNRGGGDAWERPAAEYVAARLAEDPGSVIVPYCMSGGTDAKQFARLGLACYGFTPLVLPE